MIAPTLTPPVRIGALELDSPVVTAPMVGITDAPFRALAREMGAGLVSTEMVAAEGVVRRVGATLALLDFPAGTRPVAAQLVGCDPAAMAEAARICVERGADVVDVNLGCPVRKVVGRGSGAALARDVHETARVLGAMVAAVDVPVTAKMRLGWDGESINAPELARALEDSGVSAVSVHGRTRCQQYTGRADWEQIGRVTEAVGIPVFGSGDVRDVGVIRHHIESGRVAGVIVARGSLGNLWFVRRAVHHVATAGELPDLDFAGRMELTRRHLALLCDYHGEARALRIGRKYVSWALRGCNGATRLRAEVQRLDSRERLEELLDEAAAAGLGPQGWFEPIFTSGEG